jgi:hypothetical protein
MCDSRTTYLQVLSCSSHSMLSDAISSDASREPSGESLASRRVRKGMWNSRWKVVNLSVYFLKLDYFSSHVCPNLQEPVRGRKLYQQYVCRSHRVTAVAGGSKLFGGEPICILGTACICICVIVSAHLLIPGHSIEVSTRTQPCTMDFAPT